MKIAIIGAGNMGGAIARRLVADGYTPSDITVSAPHAATLDAVAAQAPGITVTTSNQGAIKGAGLIILAVKPWIVPGVLEEIAPFVAFREQSIVSLAAGISLADIDEMLHRYSSDRTTFRVIPNTAMAVGESMTFISHCDTASPDSIEAVTALFDRLGTTAVIEERLMGAATALCSCGIAYAMRYVRAATEGAVELGIYPAKARDYILATLKGAVALLEATGNNPEVEIDKVTTPGGITIKGLNAMEAHGFTTSVVEGLKASAK